MNCHAKFDAASFTLGGKMRNHTKKQTKLQTNSNRYIHSTHCLSACVDKKETCNNEAEDTTTHE